MSLESAIKNPNSEPFRRAYIKRRSTTDGLFEQDWVEITDDVKKWGRLRTSVDVERLNKFKFANARLVMANEYGKYNPEDNENSLWYGFGPQQRSLVMINAGYVEKTKTNGVWTRTEYPEEAIYDTSLWDTNSSWDSNTVLYKGIISGDIPLNSEETVTIPVSPLNEVFRQFSARNLTGFTSTGMTASQFIEMVRDQQDSSGNYIFRPFFDNTASSWAITPTTNVYGNLNTSTAEDVRDSNVWDIMEKLAEAENYLCYVSRSGYFMFEPRDENDFVSFNFVGSGFRDGNVGQTIKSISNYGKKYSNLYTRVELQWKSEDTTTSFEIRQTELSVEPGNAAWYFGQKTYSFQNFFIPTSTVAEVIADDIFDEVSTLREWISFSSILVPGLDILRKITVYHDTSPIDTKSLWDVNNWADTIGAASSDDDLLWDASKGNAILLQGEEFGIRSYEVDLDNFETRIEARRV